MKKNKLLLVSASLLFCSMMSSCILFSGIPLSQKNNDHPTLLSGTWSREVKEKDGKTKKEIVEIEDLWNVFSYKAQSEKNPIQFILTKLGSYYFISLKTKEQDYYIFRIQFDQKELVMLGLNQKGFKLADNKVYKKAKANPQKLEYLMNENELQKWCLQNAECFDTKIFTFKRVVQEKKSNDKANHSSLETFLRAFASCIEEMQQKTPQKDFTTENIREYGLSMRRYVYDLLSIISRADIPTDVRDAAIEYVQTYSSLSNSLINAPYLPKNASDAFAMGFVKGLSGDLSGGNAEISAWKRRVNDILSKQDEKKQAFLIVLIKHGFKL